MADELLTQPPQIHAALAQPGHFGQGLGGVLPHRRAADGKEIAFVGDAGHLPHGIQIHLIGDAGAGVQNGQGVPQSAVGQPGDQLGSLAGKADLFLSGHLFQPGGDVGGLDAAEIIPLAAGEDGGGHLVDLGGGQNKDDVRRRLLHDLQQGVEGRDGEHVHLVDDIHLVLADAGGIGGLVPQIPDTVHAVVGGGVDLHHVQDGAVVHPPADLALAAGISLLAVGTVHRLGKDLGAGGLAGSPGAGEQIGMADAAGAKLILQRRHDGLLAHHILKPHGPPFAVKRTICHSLLPFLQSIHKSRTGSGGIRHGVLLGIRRTGDLRRTGQTT